MKKTIPLAIVIIGLLFVLFVPYRTDLVPKWRLQILNERGEALPGVRVRQSCKHHTYDVDVCLDTTVTTDSSGFVEFPERSFEMSLIVRAPLWIKSHLFMFAHGSVGPSVYVTVLTYNRETLSYEQGSGSPPERFTIKYY